MAEKIVLIDGHSILNRAFYGVPDLTNAQGLHTNGIYGFLNILFKILDEEKPQYLCVAFDVSAPTFRHKMFEQYKGTRKPMPVELKEQVPVLQDVLKAMGITIVTKAGLEADDILGTLARQGEAAGMDVTLVSGDRDLLQIATDRIKIRIPKTKGGKTETEDYYTQDVINKYQVNPTVFIELKALMGDTADNIPGVPKVGEKTATDLLVTYGSLQGVYDHINEITKKSIKESLIENEDLAWLSKTLATIKTDCELEIGPKDAALNDFYTKEAYDWFVKLEFKNMLSKFDKDVNQNDTVAESFQTITDLIECENVFAKAKEAVYTAVVFTEDGAVLSYAEDKTFAIREEGFITKEYLAQKVKELSVIVTFDAKKQYVYLKPECTEAYFDSLIAAYLINPLKSDYSLSDIANEYLGMYVQPEVMKEHPGYLSYILWKTYPVLKEKLKEEKMDVLFRDIEMPLSLVLFEMEQEGITLDKEALKEYGEKLKIRIDELEGIIYEKAGMEFNINSPKQLGEVLFEKMQIPGGKKTKTGYSTAADVLEKLAPDYPIVNDILEYRGLAKLKSTYADGLSNCVKEDGKIHTTFNQTITATGRISSTEPNLQNIPMRMELGRKVRKAFIPKEGCVFVDADYSQIELRLLAHMSNDLQLIEAYKEGADIHRITASKVFHTPFEEVTDLQRRNAKAVNFGIVYGISSFGLSQDLSITRKEAEGYIKEYFEQYPGVKQFLDDTVSNAETDGFVTTMYQRKRPIPEIKSSNFMQRSFGKRVAMNSPIQGTAADIMKIAMIRVWKALKEEKLRSKILIQVHDELLLEVWEEEKEVVAELLEREMKEAAKLSVSLEVDVHSGKDWYDAK